MPAITPAIDHERAEYPQASAALAAEGRLRTSSYLELHNLRCRCHGGVLSMQGRVSSYHVLQVALSLVKELEGVSHIDNQVIVISAQLPRNF